MKRVEYFQQITDLFRFKTITDEEKREFVLFSQCNCDSVENVQDKTEFEAYENHIHLINYLKKEEFYYLIPIAKTLGQAVLDCLSWNYPEKKFMVYVSLHMYDSMIIRFHQKWENEQPYCNPQDFNSENEKVFLFET